MPGRAPLHADMTAFLLARGADPHAPGPRTSAGAKPGLLGHWLAAEIIREMEGPGIPRTRPGRALTACA